LEKQFISKFIKNPCFYSSCRKRRRYITCENKSLSHYYYQGAKMSTKKVPMFDRISAQFRHLILIFTGAIVGPLALQVQNGVNPLTWNTNTLKELVGAGLAAVAGSIVLYITPLTKQYGVGKGLDTSTAVPASTASDAALTSSIVIDLGKIKDQAVSDATDLVASVIKKQFYPLFPVAPTTVNNATSSSAFGVSSPVAVVSTVPVAKPVVEVAPAPISKSVSTNSVEIVTATNTEATPVAPSNSYIPEASTN
jgi:hypothetical protein